MKQKLWVYKSVKSPASAGAIRIFSQEVESLRNDQYHELLGTTELEIDPPMKEVEKEVKPDTMLQSCNVGEFYLTGYVPREAYDVKITYRVKEPA